MMPARSCVFVIMLTSTTSESQPADHATGDVLLPLYQRLAAHYSKAMELGSLKPGERMPSVRELMARHDISLSTALQVLRFLEAQGCLEARPRVGYFVCATMTGDIPLTSEPDLSQPLSPGAHAHFVGINEHISLLLERGRQAEVYMDIGGCTPPASLFDHHYLNKTVTRLLREHPTLLSQGRSLLANQGNHPLFQQAMARRALASGIRVAPVDVLATTGNSEAVSLALAAVASPGDMVAVESPTYYGLLQVVESLQLKTLEIPCSPRTGMSIEALELAFQTQPRLKAVVVVPDLQMPLGARMPDEKKARLVALCAAHGAALIEDDSYGLFVEGLPVKPLKAWDSVFGHVIYCQAFNKSLAPGLRQGWMRPMAWPHPDAEICTKPQYPDAGAAGRVRGAGLTHPSAQPGKAQAAAQATARGHGQTGCTSFPAGHAHEPARRRPVPVAGVPRADVNLGPVHGSPGARHTYCAGQHVFQLRQV